MGADGKDILSRRDRKKEETKLRIIQAAMELFRKQGFDAVTMEQIAEEADVAKGTLYNYFPVKGSIVLGFMQKHMKDNETRRNEMLRSLPDTRSRLLALFRKTSEWMKANRDIVKGYIDYRMQNIYPTLRDQTRRSGFNDILTAIIRTGQESGEIRTDLPAEKLAGYLELPYLGVILKWLAGAKKEFPKDSLEKIVGLFLDGALAKKETKKMSSGKST